MYSLFNSLISKFSEFWLAHPCDQRTVTHHKNVGHLKERWGKKFGCQFAKKIPLPAVDLLPPNEYVSLHSNNYY